MNKQPLYGELGFDDAFNFSCGDHVSCFVACCTGTKVWLYPYDVLRIRRNLNLTSTEFLRRFTYYLHADFPGYPILLINRADEGEGRCAFAEDSGCTIYPDRPWLCRMFPVMPDDCLTDVTPEAERRFRILEWDGCCGVGNGPAVTVREWWQRTGMTDYEEAYLDWQKLTDELKASALLPLAGMAAEQFILGSYDPDRFRDKLLAGEFMDVFPLDEAELERAADDDLFLLQLSCRWLRRVLLP